MHSSPDHDDERRAHRAAISELHERIREGNEERADLRRRLAALTRAPRATASLPEIAGSTAPLPQPPDDAGSSAVELAGRQVLVPRFDRRAEDALRGLPRRVAGDTVKTVAALAAGDVSAWHQVKQAKDFRRPLLMARAGLHHRVLLRIEDGAMVVLDLVTREGLDLALGRLRAAG